MPTKSYESSCQFIIPMKSVKFLWIFISVISVCAVYVWFGSRFGWKNQSIYSSLHWEENSASNSRRNSSRNNSLILGLKRQNSVHIDQDVDSKVNMTEAQPTSLTQDTYNEVTETADVTKTPAEVTETADVTKTPAEATETADVTKTPEATETAAVTEAPKETETPAVTETPEETETATVTKTPEETETADLTKKPEVIQKVYPQIEMTITQALGDGHPLVDGVPLKFTCKAFSNNNYSLDKFVDIKWTGVGFQKSLWVKQFEIKRQHDHIERVLQFRPCLEYHAGDYTCHLTVRDKDGSTFMVNETKELKREYRGLQITRMASTKLDNSPVIPSKWFPNANLCGGSDDIWQQYADFHAAVVSGKQKGKFLIFDCTQRVCAGWGNRVQSITSLLIVAMLTNHVFLIDAPNPVSLDHYLLPNAIQWNYTLPGGLKSRFVNLFGTLNFGALENAVFNPDQQDVVRVQTYFGTVYFYECMSQPFVDKIISTFKLKTLHDLNLLYGCTFDYLFQYEPKVRGAIETMQQGYHLETGKFVALHVRTHMNDQGHQVFNPYNLRFPFKKMYDCAVKAAKALSHKLNIAKVPIFLATDYVIANDFAKKNYPGMMTFSSAPFFHIDRTKYGGSNAHQQYDDGMIGIFSDIEICSRAAVLIRSTDSSFSEEMGALHYMPPKYNLHPFYFYENLTLCELL